MIALSRDRLRSRLVVLLEEGEMSRTLRLTTVGAVVVSALLPLIELARIAIQGEAMYPVVRGSTAAAVVATGLYVPLYLRLVVHAVQPSRPRGAGWTVALMTVVIVAATPLIGADWLFMYASLALAVLIVVRPPWSFFVSLGVVGAAAPLALALGEPGWSAIYFSVAMGWRVVTLFVIVWLVAAARQLHAARLALTDEAVLRERIRIQDQLRVTVGDALATIARQGERAAGMACEDARSAEAELRTLVEGSRRTLAEARRISNSFQQASLRAELDTAVTLLQAAGIDTQLKVPQGDLFEPIDESMRSKLRSATARLLGDGTVRRCTIVMIREAERLHLEVRPERKERETMEVVA
jgi:two-component system sensor histidine kinase DesK